MVNVSSLGSSSSRQDERCVRSEALKSVSSAEAICPTNAVVRDNGTYRIDQLKCIRCDACREQAPYAIAIVDEFAPA